MSFKNTIIFIKKIIMSFNQQLIFHNFLFFSLFHVLKHILFVTIDSMINITNEPKPFDIKTKNVKEGIEAPKYNYCSHLTYKSQCNYLF
jgi:hypothetical protein